MKLFEKQIEADLSDCLVIEYEIDFSKQKELNLIKQNLVILDRNLFNDFTQSNQISNAKRSQFIY